MLSTLRTKLDAQPSASHAANMSMATIFIINRFEDVLINIIYIIRPSSFRRLSVYF